MTTSAAMPDKATLRTAAMARRDGLDTVGRTMASAEIARRAVAVIGGVRPVVLSAYLPIRSEVDPAAILDWAFAEGIQVALPAVAGDRIVFRRYRPGDPLAGAGFGTRGPDARAPILDPDLIVVPLVAFDRAGTRIGYGKGHYDRAIAALSERSLRPRLLGIAFAAQEVAAIPAEPHDVRLDWVVTQRETLDFSSR